MFYILFFPAAVGAIFLLRVPVLLLLFPLFFFLFGRRLFRLQRSFLFLLLITLAGNFRAPHLGLYLARLSLLYFLGTGLASRVKRDDFYRLKVFPRSLVDLLALSYSFLEVFLKYPVKLRAGKEEWERFLRFVRVEYDQH